MAITLDPVCGMEVDRSEAVWKTEIEAKIVFFCSPVCKQTFDNNLDKLLELERLKEKREVHQG